jgi:hypothetical protein
MDSQRAAADGACDQRNNFVEGEGLGTDRIEGLIARAARGLDGEVGEVLDEYRLNPIGPGARDRKQRNPPLLSPRAAK